MSRWGGWGSYPRAPKKPPPEHGIKIKKAGTTWWGQRWIEALENVLRGDAGRLARGRTYARAGRTHDLVVEGGVVTAKVTGSRSTPYQITIELAQLPDPAWTRAIAGMAARAQFAAELLAGRMPHEIDEVFRAAGTSLFPARRADLVTSCSCPDWGDPCKHVAATHYVLGEALDRDPFLLSELRGRTRSQLLDALRLARAGEPAPAPRKARGAVKAKAKAPAKAKAKAKAPEVPDAPEVARVALGKIAPADYDRAPEALPSLHFSFDQPIAHGAVLRQLGAPAAWGGDGSPADALSPIVRRAAEAARRIALAEPDPAAAPDDGEPGPARSPVAPKKPRRARPR
ncbi:MAG TPA: SWIM zinc finger family protein [Kofleriaceae bacterium]|nr:SWIM zinc finger family protein [Kofleriaceae bacterium]